MMRTQALTDELYNGQSWEWTKRHYITLPIDTKTKFHTFDSS